MAYIGTAPTKVVSRQSVVDYRYIATEGQTAFTGADLNNQVLACNPADMDVYLNGVRLDVTDWSATATTLTLAVGATAGDEVTVAVRQTFEVADTYAKTTADDRFVNAAGDTMTGDLNAPNNIIGGFQLNAGSSTDSSANVGIHIYHGNDTGGYGKIRFYEGAAQLNLNTIHSFGQNWQGGSFTSASAGAINLSGYNGATLGDWNNPALLVSSGASGQVYTPHIPVFWAYNAGGTVATTTGFVTFTSTDVNNGGHYNTSNGRFTAPVSGYYEFDGMLLHRTNGVNGPAEWSFTVNGTNVSGRGLVYSNASTVGGHIPTYSSFRRWLSAGDYVQMYIHYLGSGMDYYTGERLAHFSGKFIG